MEESILKNNLIDQDKGFTLIEGIVAIAIASVGLVLILSLIGMSLDINIKAQFLLNHSAKINSLADELRRKEIAHEDNQAIDDWLQENYPEFTLQDFYQTEIENLWMIEIEQKDHKKKNYYIAFYGENK